MEEASSPGTVEEADREYLCNLVQCTIAGFEQLNGLRRQWNVCQRTASHLVNEELNALKLQLQRAEIKRQSILQASLQDSFSGSVDDRHAILHELPPPPSHVSSSSQVPRQYPPVLDNSQSSVAYWKMKTMQLDALLAESLTREDALLLRIRQKLEQHRQHCHRAEQQEHQQKQEQKHQQQQQQRQQEQQQQRQQQEQQQRQLEQQLPSLSPPVHLQSHLERVNNFLHFALKNAPFILSHLDKDLKYRFVYNQYPGYGPQEIIGKTMEEIYKGQNLSENDKFKKQVLQERVPALREFTYSSNLIGFKSFLTYAHPVYRKNGGVLGLNVIHVDVSDQCANREKLIRIREEVAVHRAMEKEMLKMVGISEQTMKAKELLATMSREIRSPLSGVVSMAGVLAASDLDEEQRHLVEVMVASGDLVLQLLGDILDFSSAESGTMKLEEAAFSPREMVKSVLLIAAASLQKNLMLDGFVSKNVPLEVVGDLLRLRQILTNLVSNAVKFTHQGTVEIVMEAVQGVEKGQNVACVEFKVIDTGIGIPESALPFLFTKYIQASESHQRKYGGTGLGLAISKQLVELMGGTLKVYSKQGEGSTFSFVVPFKHSNCSGACESDLCFRFTSASQKLKKRPQQAELKSELAVSKRATKQTKILLAEDNKVNILVAQKMLKHFSLEARVVTNGIEAVRAAREEHYDLILMDLFMPEMDGLEATKLIREFQASETCQRSSIVAMTANTFDEDVCIDNGMDSFVTKPVSFDKMQRVIEQFLPKS